MTFEELYRKCVGDGTAISFANRGGVSMRMLNYVLAYKRQPSVYVWRAFRKARPDLEDEIDAWFQENLLCSY